MSLRTAAVALSIALPASALAYPLNPWGAVIPDKTVAINPFVYGYFGPGGGVEPILYAGAGAGDKFDVYAGASYFADTSGSGGSGFDTVELFPRYFIGGTVGITPHFYWTPSDKVLVPAPELHYAGSWDKFAFTLNTGWKPDVYYGGDGGPAYDNGNVFAMLAPEWYFDDQFSVFVEVHDYLYLDGSKANENLIAPGVWFALDKDQVNSFAVAGQADLFESGGAVATSYSVGVWYATSFGIGGS